MKKIIYLLTITFLLIQSCSSSENSSETNNDNTSLLIKRWYFVSETYQGQTHYPIVCNNRHRDYVDFLSSNVADFNYVASSSGTNCSDQYVLEKYNWIKNGNTISLKVYGTNVTSSETLTITELTATSLKFTATDAITHNSAIRVYTSN